MIDITGFNLIRLNTRSKFHHVKKIECDVNKLPIYAVCSCFRRFPLEHSIKDRIDEKKFLSSGEKRFCINCMAGITNDRIYSVFSMTYENDIKSMCIEIIKVMLTDKRFFPDISELHRLNRMSNKNYSKEGVLVDLRRLYNFRLNK